MDRHWAQLGYQVANSVAGMGYSFIVTVRDAISNLPIAVKLTDSASDHYFMGHALHSISLPPLQ
jgi:hypothetical protein